MKGDNYTTNYYISNQVRGARIALSQRVSSVYSSSALLKNCASYTTASLISDQLADGSYHYPHISDQIRCSQLVHNQEVSSSHPSESLTLLPKVKSISISTFPLKMITIKSDNNFFTVGDSKKIIGIN